MSATNKKANKANKKGLTTADLLGVTTVRAKRISASLGRFPGSEEKLPILEVEIMEGDFAETRVKYGVVSQAIAQKLLDEGEETEEGIFVYVPSPDPKRQINWIQVL